MQVWVQSLSQEDLLEKEMATHSSILVFLNGKSHGHRSLAGYSPWGSKELDTTERLTTHTRLVGLLKKWPYRGDAESVSGRSDIEQWQQLHQLW